MRFSLRNSQVKITFLCLRSLLMLLLRLCNTFYGHFFPSHTTTPSLKSLRRRVGYFLLEYTLVIYASMIIRFSSFDFLLSRGEIDRISFPLPQATRSKFSFFDFTLYRLDLRRMTFLSAKTRYKRVLQPRHRNVFLLENVTEKSSFLEKLLNSLSTFFSTIVFH